VRGTTRDPSVVHDDLIISIHVPREGDDSKNGKKSRYLSDRFCAEHTKEKMKNAKCT
jgi:hypothetical protein